VKEGQHLEELDVGGRKMLKWILKKLDGDVDWIHLAQEMDSCWSVFNMSINLWSSDRLWGPQWVQACHRPELSGQDVNLTAHIHPSTKLGMRRAFPRLPLMPSWCAQGQIWIFVN
jgi:hypothetical protein